MINSEFCWLSSCKVEISSILKMITRGTNREPVSLSESKVILTEWLILGDEMETKQIHVCEN